VAPQVNAMSTSSSDSTAHWPTPVDAGKVVPDSLSTLVKVDLAGLSHPGLVRPNNEDHFLITRFGRFFERLQANFPRLAIPAYAAETGYAMAVADGIGGNAGGEVASQFAIRELVNLVLYTPDWILRVDDIGMSEKIMRRASERWGQINKAMAEEAEADPTLHGFGTTLTVAWSLGADLFLAHTGDSRAYLLRGASMHQLTRDHTLAQELADRGGIERRQVASHGWRHILTRHLGSRRKHVQPDVQRLTLADGDCLLLCSDGLTEMVGDDHISTILQQGASAAQACDALVQFALENGGKDNVTVVVARYQVPQQ
jgi:protein phosphatase